MADNIHALPNAIIPGKQVEPNEEAVQLCKDILQLAEEGKVRSVAFATISHDGSNSTGWSSPVEKPLLLGAAIHRLAFRYETAQSDGEPSDLPSTRA